MGQFSIQVRAFADKTQERAGQVIRKVALDAFSEVILRTPVDTGRARGNWQVAVGRVPSGRIDRFDPSGQAAIGAAQTAVGTFMPGSVIYLANNLPYIERLEGGYSRQAPSGMVALTAQRFQAIVAAALAQVGAR